MPLSFRQSSYRSQLLRLRKLSKFALQEYGLTQAECSFIHYGENATYKVTDKNGAVYLLRLHRDGYHTHAALKEEMAFLAALAKKKRPVPVPVLTLQNKLLANVGAGDEGAPQFASLLRWMDGRLADENMDTIRLNLLGQQIGQLHRASLRRTVTHRHYWDVKGLVGISPKWGSIEKLAGANKSHQEVITAARQKAYRKLSLFAQQHPERLGLIHADLHFGNIIETKDGSFAFIDFDDCGYGFRAYDLVVPYLSSISKLSGKDSLAERERRQALIAGYSMQMPWDRADERVFDVLVAARKLASLGWLNSRSDIPRLKQKLPGAIKETARWLADKD